MGDMARCTAPAAMASEASRRRAATPSEALEAEAAESECRWVIDAMSILWC
jgi:hypothetical protein